MRLGLSAAVTVLALGCSSTGPRVERGGQGSCTRVQAVRQVHGESVCEDVFTCVRPPGGPLDRIGLRRLALCDHGGLGPVVLYLPGAHMNVDRAPTDARYDLRLYLAIVGARTWGIDYRPHAVAATADERELATLAGWDAGVLVDDAAWASGFVRGMDPGPLFVAGFSYGAGLAYRLAARDETRPAGLIILDGFAGGGGERSGPAAVDVGSSRLPYADRERLLTAVIEAPTGPSPLPGYRTAADALADVVYTSASFGGNGGLSAARQGVTEPRPLAQLLKSYDRWWPRAAFGASTPSPPEKPLPLIAFTSTNIGPAWVEQVRASAEAFGGPRAEVRTLNGYGHLDVLVGRGAARLVYEPIRAWLEALMTPR